MPRSRAPIGRRVLLSTALVGAATLAPVSPAPAASPTPTDRQQQYAAAAAEYGVPESVLLAVSYLESRWDTNAGTPSTSAGYGPMHLTDATYVNSLGGPGHYGPAEDPRGDDSRAPIHLGQPAVGPAAEPALQTLDAAAAATGTGKAALRSDPAANIRGGAALLAAYQKAVSAPVGTGTDPGAWYGAVARYSGSDRTDSAAIFADEVYATIRTGAARTTDDGQRVALAGRAVTPQKSWLDRLGLHKAARAAGVECPAELACEWIPAPYQLLGDGTDPEYYGNHDLSERPARQKIEYIVIHDTEETYARTLELVQDPAYVSWHYTMRSSDGHTAQHVRTKDVAWQAGNWYVNSKSIGIEHEGFARQGTWYTEALYRNSAKLVRYLAKRFDIPLDRQHIIGHDNVPGTVPSTVRGMHWDPGPYWDWSHYFDLLKAPFHGTGTPRTGLVTIDPDFATNRPAFWGCTLDENDQPTSEPCPLRGSSSVILHSAPRDDAPLVTDIGLHPDGSPSTMEASDHGARASAGQTYAVADRQGDWTAIWYLGQKAWFHNPASAPAAKWATGFVVTPKPGRASIPVYGRAYPEEAAYPPGAPYQTITPLQYTLPAGQRYAVGLIAPSEFYKAYTFAGTSPGDWTVIRGKTTYVQVQFGHRIMFVNRDDVLIEPSTVGAPG
ncbi:N-acetylmuramoyl-L-alanine amidase [Micromonospora sp. DR5-3]|uniref:N-acetylmuramoyl-L-alanine amidase n=1 Tax=unclassified Micromonospora TaxID=2617518 RepID=UPI0011D4C8FC|nr:MULTISPECIES: peptidoglycan recognition family protein [unclassified Micromonospora]MCW3816685.1 N-acetylmuramoyl-L-alanine amidase [Micromonospora sp. DR5-3]TYC22549.1 N-acetylmuramoyl-L-alanine amidase [Micromonospora sp. MP36]